MKKSFYIVFHIGIIVMFLFVIALFGLELRSSSGLSGELKGLDAAQGESRIQELQSELSRQRNENNVLSSQLNGLEEAYSRTQSEIAGKNADGFST